MAGKPRGCAKGKGTTSRLRAAVILLAALVGGGMLALLVGASLGGGHSVAMAAGSGNPVMRANGLPATLDPASADANNPQLEFGGLFALSYPTGKSITFAEDLSYSNVTAPPPPGDFKLRWSFGDNTASVVSLSPTHTYAKAGTYLVLVEYYDTTSSSWLYFDYAHITITSAAPLPNPPVAKVAASATSLEADATITFDASASKSQDGSALTYSWDFNDGTRATGVKVTHQYVETGKTFVELTVTDARGAKSVATLNLVVVPSGGLPTAAVLPSATAIDPGGNVTFDASQSQLPTILANDRFVDFVWDFGDGTPRQTTTTPTVSHTFARAGKYSVTLQAYDAQGAAGTTTVTITVGAVDSSGSTSSAGGGGANGPLIGFGGVGLVALAIGGYFMVQAQRRRNALIRARQAAMELARARRVTVKRDASASMSQRLAPPRTRPPTGPL